MHYLYGGNGLAAIYVINDGKDSLFAAATDRRGSLTATLHTASGTVERYSYKPFGERRNPDNWLLSATAPARFSRGYCMHEHVPEFNLIDMNGRMYDPILCQFVSPDPYVQNPTCWQNFNRYGYCLQNPMQYSDPDGEWAHIAAGALIGGLINWGLHGFEFNSSGLTAFGVGAAAGALGAATFGVAACSLGATFGASSVTTAFAAGTMSSFASNMLLSTGNNVLLGDPLMSPQSMVFSSLIGGAFCGVTQGVCNWIGGNNFWTGKPIWEDVAVDGIPIDESMIEPLELKSQPKPQQTPETASPTSAVSGSEVKYTLETTTYPNALSPSEIKYPTLETPRPQISGYVKNLDYKGGLYHKFPYYFDNIIVSEGEFSFTSKGNYWYVAKGSLNGENGWYTIGMRPNGVIYHRCFYTRQVKVK